MGSLSEQGAEEEVLQHGHFPYSISRDSEETQCRYLDILKPEDLDRLDGGKSDFFEKAAKAAWAIVLRSYVRSNFVSFASFSGHSVRNYLHYQLADHALLVDIDPIETSRDINGHLAQVNINTAVDFSGLCTRQNDSRLNKRDTGQIERSEDFLLILNVCWARSTVSLMYEHPTLSEFYAKDVGLSFRQRFLSVVNHGDRRLDQLDMMNGDELDRIVSWNPPYPFDVLEDSCMHRLVEAKAREVPASEAVYAWDGSLTYTELNNLATGVAQRLVRLGVGPGIYVPFAYEKSMWTVVATLAILKAGGAFVPVNPHDPITRLAEIVIKVDAAVVVTVGKFLPIFKKLCKHVVIVSSEAFGSNECNEDSSTEKINSHELRNGCSERITAKNDGLRYDGTCHVGLSDQGSITNGVKGPPTLPVLPSDPIFVLFTSGSTGQPKGMVLEHRAICTHALVHGNKMGYHSARVLQFAAHTFDVAIMDIFTTLIFGGCICIPSEEERRSNIVGVINSMRVDLAILTPSFAGLIDPTEVPTLKTLAIGGEALPQDRVQRWAGKVNLIQIYGPAEVGICLTMDMKLDTGPENVGYPLCNSSCWLVDPDNYDVLVPIGAVGELMVAGPSLARGYLKNEAKTRCSFIEKPAWAVRLGLQFQRFYLTGDLLRYNTNSYDGAFDIVGRKDAQIKLRGQRIEPAEIEYHIGKLAGVSVSMVTRPKKGCFTEELVCVVQVDRTLSIPSRALPESMRLVSPQPLAIQTVRTHLSRVLPTYMIPSTCLCIERMPFVPSLKIDRRRVDTWLMDMKSRPSFLSSATLSPLLTSEETAMALSVKIANLISHNDITRRSGLERHDFGLQEAGIDSIQIISISMLLQREYSLKVSVDILLDPAITIRKLASYIDEHNSPSANGHCQMAPQVDIAHEINTLTDQLSQTMNQHPLAQDTSSPPPRNIFLTGATGYLGSAILHQLVSDPHTTIFALVRDPSPSTGLDRIIATAKTHKWWHPSHRARIRVWTGDLTKPNLDLSATHLAQLHGAADLPAADAVHAIIHNGARVHYSSSYGTLRGPNITPTVELLRLASFSRHVSHFVFVSGGWKPSSCLTTETTTTTTTTPSADDTARLVAAAGGYAQTKFVSEALVRHVAARAAFRGRRVTVVKPGYIIGGGEAGVANTSDFIWRLVAGCVEVGAVNADEVDRWVYVADADEVAGRVVAGVVAGHAAADADTDGDADPTEVTRVLSGLRFAQLWTLLRRTFHYRLEALPAEDWMARLRARVLEAGGQHPLFPLLHVLEREGGAVGEEVAEGGGGDVDDAASEANARVVAAVERNVRFLVASGFLPRREDGGGREEEELGGAERR